MDGDPTANIYLSNLALKHQHVINDLIHFGYSMQEIARIEEAWQCSTMQFHEMAQYVLTKRINPDLSVDEILKEWLGGAV